MVKRLCFMIMIALVFNFLISAQDESPEITPEVTAESTSDATNELTPEATAAPDAEATPDAEEDPNCPALVSTAIDLTEDRCEATGLNEACYGYVLIKSQSRTGQTALEQPGDIVPLLDIQTLQLSPLDTRTGQWGVLELKVETNVATIPDDENPTPTTTLQDLQFVIFGDAQLHDSGQFVQVTANEPTPIYDLPDDSADVISELDTDITAIAGARLVGDEWVRIPVGLEAGVTTLGWIPVQNLTFDTDLAILPELTPEEAANPTESELSRGFAPMQAFSIQTGLDDSPCSAAPNSGMLIQTPEGVASVTIVMDEVVIQMSGTGFVQAQPNGEFRLDVLDGEAQVTSDGETRIGVEGQSVSVELDENGQPVGVPNDPKPLDLGNTQGLDNILTTLDDDVIIPPPLPAGVPVSGSWSLAYNVASLTCPDGSEWPFAAQGNLTISAQQDGIVFGGQFHVSIGERTYQGSYLASNGDNYTNTLEVSASDRITGTTTIEFAERVCTLNVPFSLRLQSPG